jgi:hypothetical protein
VQQLTVLAAHSRVPDVFEICLVFFMVKASLVVFRLLTPESVFFLRLFIGDIFYAFGYLFGIQGQIA